MFSSQLSKQVVKFPRLLTLLTLRRLQTWRSLENHHFQQGTSSNFVDFFPCQFSGGLVQTVDVSFRNPGFNSPVTGWVVEIPSFTGFLFIAGRDFLAGFLNHQPVSPEQLPKPTQVRKPSRESCLPPVPAILTGTFAAELPGFFSRFFFGWNVLEKKTS